MKILCAWIGRADLIALAYKHASEEVRTNVAKLVGRLPLEEHAGLGPVKTLLERQSFDEIHLLLSYPEWLAAPFIEFLERDAAVHHHSLENPTDYPSVYQAVDSTLKKVTTKHSDVDLWFHLSPGTPTMAAVWVLLGKTKYPARFWQTHKGAANEAAVPFDLTVDVLPEVLRNPDRHLLDLATGNPAETPGFEDITGTSQAIRYAFLKSQKAAIREVPVLIFGESGTGKEMFAGAIHRASRRRDKTFLPINCAAIPSQLMESQLFGHRKGAFTGANDDHEGAFSVADGGTIFLDEVGELPMDIQAKLLRVLQPPHGKSSCTRQFSPVGSTEILESDIRILAATNRDLPAMIREGTFREDLYYRIAVFTIGLPPLRERRKDISLIADVLLELVNRDFQKQEPGYESRTLTDSAASYLTGYSWPGNVRQLKNALIQAAVMSDSPEIERYHLEAATGDTIHAEAEPNLPSLAPGFLIDEYLESIQRRILEKAMQESGWVKTRAAAILGIKNHQTLDNRLKKLGITRP